MNSRFFPSAIADRCRPAAADRTGKRPRSSRTKTMRSTFVLALLASTVVWLGCATSQSGQFGGGPMAGGYGQQTGFGAGGGWARPSFGLGNLFNGAGNRGCDSGSCDSGGCYGGGSDCSDCGSGDCASGNCGTGGNFSDSGFDCGPMCGAYLNENQFSDPTSCSNCEVGPSYVGNQLQGWRNWMKDQDLPNAPFKFARPCFGRDCGECQECAATGRFRMATCKGLGASVGCFGCNDCGGGAAIGLANSQGTGGGAGGLGSGFGGGIFGGAGGGGRMGGLGGGAFSGAGGGAGAGGRCIGPGNGCRCASCLARLRGNRAARLAAGKRHPYGGEIPHTASAAGAFGGAGGSTAPSYVYPYYTTRGPRDFLQDACDPPQIYPHNPQPNCLPTIGR